MIKLNFTLGKIKWRTFSDIPPENMSNMDEVATNSHDNRKRLITSVLHLGRLYQEVNGGDSKMSFHITVALTSKPNGKFTTIGI